MSTFLFVGHSAFLFCEVHVEVFSTWVVSFILTCQISSCIIVQKAFVGYMCGENLPIGVLSLLSLSGIFRGTEVLQL